MVLGMSLTAVLINELFSLYSDSVYVFVLLSVLISLLFLVGLTAALDPSTLVETLYLSNFHYNVNIFGLSCPGYDHRMQQLNMEMVN